MLKCLDIDRLRTTGAMTMTTPCARAFVCKELVLTVPANFPKTNYSTNRGTRHTKVKKEIKEINK